MHKIIGTLTVPNGRERGVVSMVEWQKIKQERVENLASAKQHLKSKEYYQAA